jgi:diacylglycerol kinase family enzyme
MPGYKTYISDKISSIEVGGVCCVAAAITFLAMFAVTKDQEIEVKIYDQEFKNEKYRIFIFEDKFQVIPLENKAEKD